MAKTWRDKELSPWLLNVQTNQGGKNAKSIAIPHELGVLTRVLGLDSLELILVRLSWILELWIINYELINNYPRLTIKSVINN
jgi:hypothetical protein